MNTKKYNTLLAITAVLCTVAMPSQASSIYSVNYIGTNIKLTGSIETNALGMFVPEALNPSLIDYQILATGYDPTDTGHASPATFLFTAANSTWGFIGNGLNININITASSIELFSNVGFIDSLTNVFLQADGITNGARENLRFAGSELGYRTPAPIPDDVYYDNVNPHFVIATQQTPAVPEPLSTLLLSAGLIGLSFVRARKSHAADNTFSHTHAA
jgi:hypothetical protein